MASMNLLSKDFIRSLLTSVGENQPKVQVKPEADNKTRRKLRFSVFNDNVEDDNDDMEIDVEIMERTQKMNNIKKALEGNFKKPEPIDLERKLSNLNLSAVKNFQL